MAVPKRKTSKSRKKQRRVNYKLKVPGMAICPQCGEIKRPHHACRNCGIYKDEEVIVME